jgi:hypothetical protein
MRSPCACDALEPQFWKIPNEARARSPSLSRGIFFSFFFVKKECLQREDRVLKAQAELANLVPLGFIRKKSEPKHIYYMPSLRRARFDKESTF